MFHVEHFFTFIFYLLFHVKQKLYKINKSYLQFIIIFFLSKINLQNKINYIIYKIKLFHVKHFSKYLFNILMINFQNKVSRETIIKL